MKKSIALLVAISISLFSTLFSGCSRVQSGHAGLKQNFDGTIEKTAYEPGLYPTITASMKELIANEMTVELKGLTPQTKDKSLLRDLDSTVMYSIQTDDLAKLYIAYKNRHMVDPDHVIYPMYKYVENVAISSFSDVIGQYDSLDANLHRDEIIKGVERQMAAKFKEEGLDKVILVKQVMIKNLLPSASIQASAERVITAKNDNAAKEIEVDTAAKEARRIENLTRGITPQYIAYLNAQAMADAIKSGHVPNWMVTPTGTNMLLNVGK